jgi:hypothetical protein
MGNLPAKRVGADKACTHPTGYRSSIRLSFPRSRVGMQTGADNGKKPPYMQFSIYVPTRERGNEKTTYGSFPRTSFPQSFSGNDAVTGHAAMMINLFNYL